MSQKSSSNEQGVPLNATTILALLTLLGGVLVAGHKLASDRPVVPPGASNSEISEQKVDTRLWEDPFSQASRLSATNELVGNLAGTLMDSRNKGFRLMAVMVPGGPASESREHRIRSRFAVVSALAESAYSPSHPSQMGIAAMPWPSTLKFSDALSTTNKTGGTLENLYERGTNYMLFGFEWYAVEQFAHHRSQSTAYSNAPPLLLVWLDEEQFGDLPIARLNLFFTSLAPNNWWASNCPPNVPMHPITLIGPGHSGTLKAMLASDYGTNILWLGNKVLPNLTQHISQFLATPRAIDEVLVKDPGDAPRTAVLRHLNAIFTNSINFAATDSDLAHEALAELKKRGVDLADKNQHLVLIGGWDEYFGRMLSAAYAAELAVVQTSGLNRARFLADYPSGTSLGPSNLHTFYYLSGLDGQGLSTQAKNNPQQPDSSALKDDSKELKNLRWTPDLNRAEGPAQFDYLGRLAGRIEALGDQLINDGSGTISAIGISGGDVYDTLLILQALRRRFPETLFFTTDLDARFWDPKEWSWSRNLVVVSAYGLMLSEKFQHQTAPFRDSTQTALFAAALAALGDTNLQSFKGKFPVRHFEIGRDGPVDLSDPASDPFGLHPHVEPWPGFLVWLPRGYHLLATVGLLIGAFLLALVFWRGFRQFTIARNQFRARPLWLREEDIGGLEGFLELAEAVWHSNVNPAAHGAGAPEDAEKRWLKDEIRSKIANAEDRFDESFEERGATEVFGDADSSEPKEFVNVNFAKAQSHGVAVLLSLKATSPSSRQLEARWRKKGRLAEESKDLCLKDLLSSNSHQRQHDWRRESRKALQEPERRDALRVAMLQVLDSWNARLGQSDQQPPLTPQSSHSNGSPPTEQPRQQISPVRNAKDLDRLKENRDSADKLIEDLLGDGESGPTGASPKGSNAESNAIAKAARVARDVSRHYFTLCSLRIGSLAYIIGGAILLVAGVLYTNLHDTPYSLWDFSGASLWPTNWLALLSLVLGFLFLTESYFQLRQTVFVTTRQCRLGYTPQVQHATQNRRPQWRAWRRLYSAISRMFYPSSSVPVAVVNADQAWELYQRQGRGVYRFWRTLFFFLVYQSLLLSAYELIFGHQYRPFLRAPAGTWYQALVWPAFLVFVFLSFWTIDAACLCRWFIQRISQGPTDYSLATRQHFSRQRGQVPYHVLSEWIDVSIIAQMTERVGRLIYFPAVLLLLLLLSNDGLLYYFPWPPAYYVLVTCNLVVAAASVVILQGAARKARNQSVEALEEKLNQLRRGAATTEAQKKQHHINETEDMLNEIRSLKKGAFGGFWSNPVVGALLIPSGGTALVEIISYLIK